MTELTLLILRLGFLLMLWLFVFSIVYALRSDLFGAPVRRMKKDSDAPVPAAVPGSTPPGGVTAAPVIRPSGGALPSAGTSAKPKQLVILSGLASGSTIPLDDDIITIGRSPDSTLVIVDEYTSTYHARLERTGDEWTITDLDSTNGTKVAGKRISAPMSLATHVPVTIGTTTFELRP